MQKYATVVVDWRALKMYTSSFTVVPKGKLILILWVLNNIETEEGLQWKNKTKPRWVFAPPVLLLSTVGLYLLGPDLNLPNAQWLQALGAKPLISKRQEWTKGDAERFGTWEES